MAGRPKKLNADAVRAIRAWWSLKRSIPTRRQMCARHGVSENALMSAAVGATHKTVRT